MSDFPVAEKTRELLKAGKVEEARGRFCATVDDAFKQAEAGAIINLSDLFAADAALIVDRAKRGRS